MTSYLDKFNLNDEIDPDLYYIYNVIYKEISSDGYDSEEEAENNCDNDEKVVLGADFLRENEGDVSAEERHGNSESISSRIIRNLNK
jgi:hypothetical protein